ncbi:MAG: hypothetical protein KDJ99_30420, partial [Candidatus Competibacteraceae bacterium]|nr:hypothetical protein [Candidatus Competibacteraceae bacterium]
HSDFLFEKTGDLYRGDQAKLKTYRTVSAVLRKIFLNFNLKQFLTKNSDCRLRAEHGGVSGNWSLVDPG